MILWLSTAMDKRYMILLLCGLLYSEARPASPYASLISQRSVNASNYDFVIAGGGVSGLTLADRLTEDPAGM